MLPVLLVVEGAVEVENFLFGELAAHVGLLVVLNICQIYEMEDAHRLVPSMHLDLIVDHLHLLSLEIDLLHLAFLYVELSDEHINTALNSHKRQALFPKLIFFQGLCLAQRVQLLREFR